MAQLAIKGHKKRGNEVIALLEMLGGENTYYYTGDSKILYYHIDDDGEIECDRGYEIPSPCIYFTIQKFLEKFPYKVGDIVKVCGDNLGAIISMRWENDHVVYRIKLSKNGYETSKTTENLQPYKEETETMEETIKVDIPKGYEFSGIDDNQQVVFTKIHPEYPKNYDECCKVLGYSGNYNMILTTDVDNKLFDALYRLKVCRDAYWKLAGEQMGLGKPWEPDWSTESEIKYVIEVYHNNIRINSQCYSNTILAFPTKEMCDEFYNNFKKLIEECKELL